MNPVNPESIPDEVVVTYSAAIGLHFRAVRELHKQPGVFYQWCGNCGLEFPMGEARAHMEQCYKTQAIVRNLTSLA
jgi:hypothetical protein